MRIGCTAPFRGFRRILLPWSPCGLTRFVLLRAPRCFEIRSPQAAGGGAVKGEEAAAAPAEASAGVGKVRSKTLRSKTLSVKYDG